MEKNAKRDKLSIESVKTKVIDVIDENKNGEIDIEDLIIKGLKTPGIRINRDSFLQKELFKLYPQETIDIAIKNNPMTANIPLEVIDKIANETINFERMCVSGISTVLGLPGGAAMIATIPADIIQYYGYMLRAAQKLLYLYGFPEIFADDEGVNIDTGTINILIICLGVMYGVAGAKNALLAISKALGTGVRKKLIKAALTKGTIYPIVKKVIDWFGVNLTKDLFATFFEKTIPVVGGVVGGAITFATFKPCCNKLKKSLRDTRFTNPNFVENKDIIEVENIDDENE